MLLVTYYKTVMLLVTYYKTVMLLVTYYKTVMLLVTYYKTKQPKGIVGFKHKGSMDIFWSTW
jgi:hypothetical protein